MHTQAEFSTIQLLNPDRFPGMSPRMRAIVEYIVGMEPTTEPRITEMNVTSDGFVIVVWDNNPNDQQFFADVGDLERNWNDLLLVAGLSESQLYEVQVAYKSRVKDWRA